MRREHCRKCFDVSVMCGAYSNTDHQLARIKVLVGERRHYRRLTRSVVRRWYVSGLQNGFVDDNGNETVLDI